MSAMELTKLAEKVKTATKICTGPDCFCSGCPYRGEVQCGTKLQVDSATVIEGLQTRLHEVVKANEKNVDNFLTAKMELEYHMDRADALEKENGELKENNARLVEQNKKLLEKEIENIRLRKVNQSLRDENKDLDERNDKLVDELCHRDSKMRNLLEEIDRQNKELYHHREWERLVCGQPVILQHAEPIKIETIDYVKMAKAADKATKACKKLTKALDEFDKTTTVHIDLPAVIPNRVRAAFGLPPINPKPHEIAKEGDLVSVTTDSGRELYYEVMFADIDGIRDRCGVIHNRLINRIYRKDGNGDLKLIWEKK